MSSDERAEDPTDGERVGRFVIVRDIDGHRHALAALAVSALCETDDGTLLMLPGGKLVRTTLSLPHMLRILDGR